MLALSRALACRPDRSAQVIPYKNWARGYKVVDYGAPAKSFYGLIVVANKRMTELKDEIHFDFMGDFDLIDKPKMQS